MRLMGLLSLALIARVGASCAAVPEPEEEIDDEVADVERGDGVSAGTVLDAAKASCTTASDPITGTRRPCV